jgi:hypothetical protein
MEAQALALKKDLQEIEALLDDCQNRGNKKALAEAARETGLIF